MGSGGTKLKWRILMTKMHHSDKPFQYRRKYTVFDVFQNSILYLDAKTAQNPLFTRGPSYYVAVANA